MRPITKQNKSDLHEFLSACGYRYLKELHHDVAKQKIALGKSNLSPIGSIYYPGACKGLEAALGDREYTKGEFTALLAELGFPFTTDGKVKGSANEYEKVLHSFVDGKMAVSLDALSKDRALDTKGLTVIAMSLNPPVASGARSLKRAVNKFETSKDTKGKKVNNTGHQRMQAVVSFVLGAQIKHMKRVAETAAVVADAPSPKRAR
jgi:hypothetical protein